MEGVQQGPVLVGTFFTGGGGEGQGIEGGGRG